MRHYVLAEFRDEHAMVEAARKIRALGHADLDAHSPVPVHGIDEALGLRRSPVPLIALVGGVLGALGGYAMQVWMNAVDYPINVANRPLHSPPANVPITFETTVLLSTLFIVFGLFALCGLPRLHHPVFDAEAFRTHSVDGFWLSARVEPAAAEPLAEELRRAGAAHVTRVAEEVR
jgi:hypothetical protein